MKFRAIPVFLLLAAALNSCEMNKHASNPPAEGFDMANSDPRAVELADSIMNAMGGRRNWDNTRYISWDFGSRSLMWDKKDNRVRIESQKDSTIYLVDLDKLQGRVSIKGQEIAEPDSLKKMLTKGKSIWINDSYWLVMPFKLKDTGLTIKCIGEDTMRAGTKCNVLELTFNDIGDTPQNKYRIFVDASDNLVKQWSYYSNSNQDSANFTRPWDNYQKYGDILISADRSDGAGPKNVKVDKTLPDKIFTAF
jgi:hypothetical protein